MPSPYFFFCTTFCSTSTIKDKDKMPPSLNVLFSLLPLLLGGRGIGGCKSATRPLIVHADEITDNLIEWVRSKPGGYFSSKIEIRRVDPSDETSHMGVFAKEDIPANDRLMQIPRACYISILDDDDIRDMDVENTEEAWEAYRENLCKLSHKVMKEIKQEKKKSDYAPYIAYLEGQSRGQLPATWSKAGKDMLRALLAEGSNGVDWIDQEYKNTGCISPDDPFEEHLVAVTKQRCYDVALIPLWDMVNHDNGRINTGNSPMYDEDGIKVWASRKISAGEEIFATYDKCIDCMDIGDYWGTPEILRDFGFVEGYPRRLVYTDREIWFEIYAGADGVKEVRWDDHAIEHGDNPDDFDGSPGRSGIDFMQKELKRIEVLPPHEGECSSTNVPVHECEMILQYKMAATEALSLAIDSAESRLGKDEL